MQIKWAVGFWFALSIAFFWTQGWAQNTVAVTPLGSHEGEFCRNDRALIFEDSGGLRILYDPGRTVTGGTDSRLGTINVMLLSHVHVDHLGEAAIKAVNTGTCNAPDASVPKIPNSNFAEIAALTKATVLVGGEMHTFLNGKIAAAGGGTTQAQVLRPGGKQTIQGVTFATVAALHSNGVDARFLTSKPSDNLTAYVGPEEGYVITFSNGLVVYLSGDTGVISDMDTVVRKQYGAELVVINIGDVFSTGPEEGAFAVNNLIKPKAVIPSHANEEATKGGVVQPGTKTRRFMDLVKGAKVYPPLSGVTMEFTGNGSCVRGC
jgi:L-ascorbate metabolism protein UlaG (beta-lactamase superfamily)